MKVRSISFLQLIMIICIIIMDTLCIAQTNEGTDFWMTFLQHRNTGDNNMVVMISSKTSTTGTISIPLRGFTQSFSVQANDVTLIPMPVYAETIGSERIGNNAIHVTSVDPISIYIHQYQSFRAEASIVLPVSSISNEYFVLTYEGFAQEVDGASEFAVVGTEDNTTVTIEVSDKTKGGLEKGEIIEVILNQGETYQVRGLRTVNDLTGTHIQSDKNVAVFAGASYARVPISCGNRDNLLEQMYPLNTFGSQYVTAPTRQGDYNIFRILAISDNSEIVIIDIDGNQEDVKLNRGEFYEYQRSLPTVIQNKNLGDRRGFMLSQYLVGSECTGQAYGGPAMVLLSSVEQIRDTVTVYNSRFQNIFENYLSIICQTNDVDGILRNGNPITSSWTQIGLNGELSFTIESVQQGRHTLTSSGCGVIAMAYGLGEAEGYAYFGGASFNLINGNPLPDGECVGNPVQFSSGLPPDRYDVIWTTALGDTLNSHEFELDFPDDDEGEYLVKLETFDNCFLVSDTLEKILKMTYQEFTIIEDESIIICEDDLLELNVGTLANATYEWQGPNDFSSDEQNLSLDVDSSFIGNYEVTATIFGCMAQPDFVNVLINPIPRPNLGADSVYCNRSGIPHILSPGRYDIYEWSDGSSAPTLNILDDGTFGVTITDANGCSGSDEITFIPQCPSAIYIPSAFSPNGDDINDLFELHTFDVISIEFQIFDRWGNLVYESLTNEVKWDGKFKNQYASPGVYVWSLQYSGYNEEGETIMEQKKGHLQLIR